MNQTIESEAKKAPGNTEDKIVFRWDSTSNIFDTRSYVPTLTNNRVQHNQIDRFIDALKETKNYSVSQDMKGIFCIIPIFFCGFFGMFGLIIFLATSENNSFFLIPIVFFGFFFCIVGTVICIVTTSQKSYRNSIKKREEEFKKIANDFNNGEMIPTGWYWRVGTYGGWISLDRNTGMGGNGFIPIQQPQPQFLPPIPNPQMMMLNQPRITPGPPSFPPTLNYNNQGVMSGPFLMQNNMNFGNDGVEFSNGPVPYQPPVQNAKRMEYPEIQNINVEKNL